MRNHGMPIKTRFFLAALGGLILGGCMSLMERGGRLLDGSARAEKTLEHYRGGEKNGTELRRIRQKGGEEYIAISQAAMPTLLLKGSIPDPAGGFSLTALSFLCSSPSGWNEFTMAVSGRGVFQYDGNLGTLRVETPIELLAVTGGKIRHNDRRLGGAEALSALDGRYERIRALSEWMAVQPDVPRFQDQRGFESYWKPILLPELVSAKKRPKTWTAKNARWVRAEDIRWNGTYTEGLFPEELRILRDSGSLLRDWEEAAGWIYLVYAWDRIIEPLGNEIPLNKIK
jgi:hypothetical protein